MEYSKENLTYLDPYTNERYIPYCVEPALGCDRLALVALCDAYEEQQLEKDTRVVLHLHPFLAPYKACILPLSKQLNEKAKEVYATLAKHFSVTYDETGSIGKRYRRQDAIGTPLCITVDFDTVNDDSVTIRDRDSMQQIRIKISEIKDYIAKRVEF